MKEYENKLRQEKEEITAKAEQERAEILAGAHMAEEEKKKLMEDIRLREEE